MRIKSLSLKNVRSHKNNEISFNKGITVLTGRTGSGKSSVLMGIDYALFGSSNLSNSEIMRRGSKEMVIKLVFEQHGKEYTVIRGLKKSNKRITVNSENLKVIENGKQLNVLSRVNDVDNIISEIIGIPENIKASQMFQVTSYTQQDEIRKILEMKKEERQDYIDRILQLSRYKTTFENLKKVNDFFWNKKNEIAKSIEFLKNEKKDFLKIKKRLEEVGEEISDNNKKLTVLKKALKEKEEKKKDLKERINVLESRVIELKEKKSEVNSLNEQLKKIKKELESSKESEKELKKKLREESKLEIVEKELNNLRTELRVKQEKLKDLQEEKSEIVKIGGTCPTCKQLIDKEHKSKILNEFNKKINDLKCFEEKEERIKILEKNLEVLKNLKQVRERLNYQNSLFNDLKNELKSVKFVKESGEEVELKRLKKEYDILLKKDKELYSKNNSISEILEYLNNELEGLKKDFFCKKQLVNKYEEEIKDKDKVEYLNNFLKNLRVYLKDVRTVIRQKFLTDFRYEFQKKFEEIRNQEEDYSVELSFDYEPIAYTLKGEKVPINHLSGGEKTSVALAYRLALSNLAASMSNVSPAELLILDEPTTGFDGEDVKSLPEALKNITNIPQIIIVSHESLLKDIADYTVQIVKENNESVIEY